MNSQKLYAEKLFFTRLSCIVFISLSILWNSPLNLVVAQSVSSPPSPMGGSALYGGGFLSDYLSSPTGKFIELKGLRGYTASTYVPFYSAGKIRLGLITSFDYGFNKSPNRLVTISEPFKIEKTEGLSLSLDSVSENLQRIRTLASGMKFDIKISNRLSLSPVFHVGLTNFFANGFVVNQTFNWQGSTQPITFKVGSFSGSNINLPTYATKLRANYNFLPWMGVWGEIGYSHSPKFKTFVEILTPKGEPNQEGYYQPAQILEQHAEKKDQFLRLSLLSVAGGVFFSIPDFQIKGTKAPSSLKPTSEKIHSEIVKNQKKTATDKKAVQGPDKNFKKESQDTVAKYLLDQNIIETESADVITKAIKEAEASIFRAIHIKSLTREDRKLRDTGCIRLLSPVLGQELYTKTVLFKFSPPVAASSYIIKIWKRQEKSTENIGDSLQSQVYQLYHQGKTTRTFYELKFADKDIPGTFMWEVIAENGRKSCQPQYFSLAKMQNHSVEIDSIWCDSIIGNCRYFLRLRFTNQTSSSNYTITSITGYTSSGTGYTPTASVSSMMPSPPIVVNPNTTIFINMEYQPVDCNDLIAVLTVSGTGSNGLPFQNNVYDSLPTCECTACDNIKLLCPQDPFGVSVSNDVMHIKQEFCPSLIQPPGSLPFLQISAEIVGFLAFPHTDPNNDHIVPYYNIACMACNDSTERFGNFSAQHPHVASGLPSNFNPGNQPLLPPLPPNINLQGLGRELIWQSQNQQASNVNNFGMQLHVNLPRMESISCCKRAACVWIRYTITDNDCNSCSLVKRYCFLENSSTSPQPTPTPTLPIIPGQIYPGGIQPTNPPSGGAGQINPVNPGSGILYPIPLNQNLNTKKKKNN